MNNYKIGVTGSGVILLGQDVSCDGFHRDYRVRVQTHVHVDHMSNFETSKGLQDIILTDATFQLLIAEFNADISVRDNIVALAFDKVYVAGKSRIRLLPTDHMLGSVQVEVESEDGCRVGYSGDFQWPLDHVINVDELILDSTYGTEESIRHYTQAEAEEMLLNIAAEKLKKGPLHIKAHRGTVHRGLQVLTELNCSLIASPRMCSEIDVYRGNAYPIGTVHLIKSPMAVEAMKSGRYIRFYGTGDQFPVQVINGTTITLSAFRTDGKTPLLEYSERSLSVALTNHADFLETLEYVKATGAMHVITDNSRGGKAVNLAREITRRLGIKAEPSVSNISHEWGM